MKIRFNAMRTLGLGAIAALAAMCVFSSKAKNDASTIHRNLNIFNALYKELSTNYVDTLDATKNITNAIDGMLGQIDPYTEYFPLDDQDELRSISSGEYGGIGSAIVKRNGHVEMSGPQWGSPSRLAGIRHGDILLSIDGKDITPDDNISDVSARLRGQAGTKVALRIKRPYVDTDSILDITITRGNIKQSTLPYYGVDSAGIAYIRLTTFNEHSANLVRDALKDMKANNPAIKGIVLDLRQNGGGIIEGAVQIVGHFVDRGTEVVRTRGRDKKSEKIYKTTSHPIDTETPLVVLTDNNTASASEIVAGALQDLDRAVIMGERSYGKGLVQTSRPLPYGGLLKVTVARYYIPSGRLIQAIDYSHRDENGSVKRIPDSLTNVFYTRSKRPVRDGGGITPDIMVERPDMNRLLYNIISDMWDYDFANRYANTHTAPHDPDAILVDSAVFADFKAFVDPSRFKYDKACEEGIKYLRRAAKVEGYMNDSVDAQLTRLENMLKHDLARDLDINRPAIEAVLETSLAERFFNDADITRRALSTDSVYKQAVDLLLDTPRYRKILSTPVPE